MGVRYRGKMSRYHEIGRILIRHGFGYLAGELGFQKKISLFKGEDQPLGASRLTLPERVRLLFEDMGPTFIKLGQVLSTRPDLIPKDFVEELKKLQDDVEKFGAEAVKEQFQKEFGVLPDKLFKQFDYQPFASASIGQVYRAVLYSGEMVAVKVQRPNLRQVIEQDLLILLRLSGIIQKRTALGQVCDVEKIIQIFARCIRRELDYTIEGVNTEAFYRIFESNRAVLVPIIYWELTTKEIITMEYLEGVRAEEAVNTLINDGNNQIYVKNLLDAFFYPFFQEGIFHGDPHPGNILFQDQERIVLVDFGNVGRLEPSFRQQMARLLMAIMEKDVESLMEIMQETGTVTKNINHQHLYEDTAELLEKTNGVSTGQIDLSHILNGMIAISIDHGMLMQDNFFILGKAVAIIESLARTISPKANLLEMVKPLAIDYLRRQFTPSFALGKACKNTFDFLEMITSLPYDLSKTIKAAAQGEFKMIFHHRNLNWLYEMLDIASSRLAFSIIIAALIVGSALIIIMDKGPALWGYPIIGLVGFVFSGLLGSWMALIMLRRLR